ncbi:MAG: hypothetical protein K0R17_2766 [Rariglobus sp.]|jgi:hypothetical protein|nr:hypothetical protein [Rariglobus sp.]
MKTVFLIGLGVALSLHAQVPDAPPPSPVPPAPAGSAQALRSEADLNTLLGPIALYPDALIGLILPASTTPADVVMAARSLGTNTSPESLAAQPWDDSVKALTHYPDLLRWLDQNLSWTQALGQAFAAQPADVMNTVQRLRQQARAAGTLVDTPQQQVVTEGDSLVIVPARSDTIYVPVYDPAVVYVSRPTRIGHTYIYFHSAYPAGPWLCYTPNWRHHHLRVISYPYGWSQGYRYPPRRSSGYVWVPPSHRHPHLHSRPPVGTAPPAGWTRPPGHVRRLSPPQTDIRTNAPFYSPPPTPASPFRDPPDKQPSRFQNQQRNNGFVQPPPPQRQPFAPRTSRPSGSESDFGGTQKESKRGK